MQDLEIIKRDGSLVEFDHDAVKKSIEQILAVDSSMLGSGLGISLSKHRNANGRIYTNGFNSLSWFESMLVKKMWVVEYTFPFGVKHIDDEVQSEPPSWSDDRFERRIDAEKFSLEKLIGHAEQVSEDLELVEKLKEKLKNIEKEHPEWLI